VAALRENDLANHHPSLPSLTTTRGGTIAAVCSRCRSQRNLRFRHGQVEITSQSLNGMTEKITFPQRVERMQDALRCLREALEIVEEEAKAMAQSQARFEAKKPKGGPFTR
jgi:hypothetical protein